MSMRPNKNIYRFYILVCVLIVALGLFLFNIFKYRNINKTVVTEAGTELPSANVFLKDNSTDAKYVTDLTWININQPGAHKIEIEVGGTKYKVKLEIKDTTAPTAQIQDVDLYEGRTVKPSEFIKEITDATNVTVSYKAEPEYSKIGTREVELILEDTSGNKSEYKAKLRVSKTNDIVKVDIQNRALNLEAFLKNPEDLPNAVLLEPKSVPAEIGIYPAKVMIGDTTYESNISVTDLTPLRLMPLPKAYGKMTASKQVNS